MRFVDRAMKCVLSFLGAFALMFSLTACSAGDSGASSVLPEMASGQNEESTATPAPLRTRCRKNRGKQLCWASELLEDEGKKQE